MEDKTHECVKNYTIEILYDKTKGQLINSHLLIACLMNLLFSSLFRFVSGDFINTSKDDIRTVSEVAEVF